MPLFVLAHFGHHLVLALPVPLLPFIRDNFGLDYTRSGFVISAFSLSYGFSQLPAGWLADRIGPRILITIGICGVALAGLLVGLSQTYIMMIVFLVLMGVLGGGYHPAFPTLLSASVEPKNWGRALGFHTIGGGASYFLVPLIAVGIATVWGWRSPFIILALPTIVFGIIFYVLLGRRMATKKGGYKPDSSYTEVSPAPGHWRRLVAFMILSTFIAAATFSIISFIPLFMVDQFGVSKGTAAVFLALVASSGFWAGPVGGYLSDRFGRVTVVLAVSFMAGPVIYLLSLATYGLGIGAVLVTIGIINYVRMPASEAYIVSQTSERHRSTIFGIYYFLGMEGSGVLVPAVGYLIDQFGFSTTFTIVGAALLAVALGCSIFLWGSRD